MGLRRPVQTDLFDRENLAYDLFGGDRDCNVTVFSNKMVVTRAMHRCVVCCESIPVGSRVRAQVERDGDQRRVMTFYVCPICCKACRSALADADDAGRAIEARASLGMNWPRA